MLEQYYIIGSNEDGPMKYIGEEYIVEDHRAAETFEALEEIPGHFREEPYMVLRVTIEKATK